MLWEAGAEKRGDILQMVAPLTLEELMMSLSPQKAGCVHPTISAPNAILATRIRRHNIFISVVTCMLFLDGGCGC